MKKRIYVMTLALMFGLCNGCGKEQADSESKSIQAEEQADAADKTNNDIELNDNLEIDFTFDYSEDIKADVDYVVTNSTSLQEELENIEQIIQKYTPLAQSAQSQMEMNISSGWFFVIWDTELNSLLISRRKRGFLQNRGIG